MKVSIIFLVLLFSNLLQSSEVQKRNIFNRFIISAVLTGKLNSTIQFNKEPSENRDISYSITLKASGESWRFNKSDGLDKYRIKIIEIFGSIEGDKGVMPKINDEILFFNGKDNRRTHVINNKYVSVVLPVLEIDRLIRTTAFINLHDDWIARGIIGEKNILGFLNNRFSTNGDLYTGKVSFLAFENEEKDYNIKVSDIGAVMKNDARSEFDNSYYSASIKSEHNGLLPKRILIDEVIEMNGRVYEDKLLLDARSSGIASSDINIDWAINE